MDTHRIRIREYRVQHSYRTFWVEVPTSSEPLVLSSHRGENEPRIARLAATVKKPRWTVTKDEITYVGHESYSDHDPFE